MFGLGPMELVLMPFVLIISLAIPITVIAILYRVYRVLRKVEEKLDRSE